MGGENKLLLPFGDKTMLETTLDHILASGMEEVIVVAGHEAEKISALLQNRPVKVTINAGYASGMTTSIQAGIRNASPDTEGFMICLSDMPLIRATTYRMLSDVFIENKRRDNRVIVQPVFENIPGNPVIFSAFYKTGLLTLDFPEGCKPVVQANREFVTRVNVNTDAVLRDADTPEAFALLKTTHS